MKAAHREAHHSQEFIICKLPGQPLLFSVLGCSVKDKCAMRHRSVRKVKAFAQLSLLAKYTNSLPCELDFPST